MLPRMAFGHSEDSSTGPRYLPAAAFKATRPVLDPKLFDFVFRPLDAFRAFLSAKRRDGLATFKTELTWDSEAFRYRTTKDKTDASFTEILFILEIFYSC